MSIYTKKGDRGQASLADGTRHNKDELIFEVLGTIDELNSWIGLCHTQYKHINVGVHKCEPHAPQNAGRGAHNCVPLQKLQKKLSLIMAILAHSKNTKFDVNREIKWLEKEIDKMEKELPPLKNFILPGGSQLSAVLHIARTVSRRLERHLVSLSRIDTWNYTHKYIPYFNRLADYLFTLGRWVDDQAKEK